MFIPRQGYFNDKLETYVEIPSDIIPFDQKPDMKAREITAAALEALRSGKYDMVSPQRPALEAGRAGPSAGGGAQHPCLHPASPGRAAPRCARFVTEHPLRLAPQHRVNYANPDMVGHTGILPATIQAVETCDAQARERGKNDLPVGGGPRLLLGTRRRPRPPRAQRLTLPRPLRPLRPRCVAQVEQLIAEVEKLGGIFLITADHGNADDMVQREKKTNKPVVVDGKIQALTSHTLAPVPVFIGGPGLPDSVKFRTDLPDAGAGRLPPPPLPPPPALVPAWRRPGGIDGLLSALARAPPS